MVRLCCSQFIIIIYCLRYIGTGSKIFHASTVHCHKRISVESNIISGLTYFGTSVSNCAGNGFIRHSRLKQNRTFHSNTTNFYFDNITLAPSHFLCIGRKNSEVVIPAYFGNRIRKFLQPRVVGICTITQSGFLIQNYFNTRTRFAQCISSSVHISGKGNRTCGNHSGFKNAITK